MRYGKKLVSLLLSALVLTGALVGCNGAQSDGTDGFTMRACACASPDSLDPAFCTGQETEPVFRAIFENLLRLRLTEDGERVIEPAVAKEYEVVENFDGTVDYVFTLRSSARWSDGTRVKAKDFVYAWRRLVNPATQSPNAALLSMVSGYDEARESGDATQLGIVAESDSTLRVTLDMPCAWFLSDVCTAVATVPLRSDVAGEVPAWASGTDMPGNGAFHPSAWAKGQSLELRRNEHFFDAHTTTVEVLRFLFADSVKQAGQYYEDALVDYLLPVSAGTEGAQALPLRETTCVLYNHVSDVFSNKHVRRAFDLTLDRDAVAAAMGGGQTAATGLVPYGVVNTPEDTQDFRSMGGVLISADPETYAARCAEAQTELYTGGFWSEGAFPEVTCLYPAEHAACAAAARACAKLWAEQLGIVVHTEALAREAFDSRLAEGEYDLAVDAFSLQAGDAMAFLGPYAGLDGANALHYVSKPYDLLIGVADSSLDLAARVAMLHDAEALLLSETALSPLAFGARCCLVRESVTGVQHDACGCPLFNAAAAAD
ncbi:MAG: peptide ABC transporter substrate-binding protein [Oscillospiraceae bacterium]|nr:peptide ABC transporter substrate-binding protein [Oscillospiraceae bacterium]